MACLFLCALPVVKVATPHWLPAVSLLLDCPDPPSSITSIPSPDPIHFDSAANNMCFDDHARDTHMARVEMRNGRRHYYYEALPHRRTSWRRRLGLGGSYYPGRYYARPPAGRLVPAMAFPRPRPRSQYGGHPSGAVAGGYSRGVVPSWPSQTMAAFAYPRAVTTAANRSGYGYVRGGYEAAAGRASIPPGAAMRTYYNTVPSYGYTAHVYPPGPTTTTTTYHVTNAQAQPYPAAPQPLRETRPAFGHPHGHPQQGPSRE